MHMARTAVAVVIAVGTAAYGGVVGLKGTVGVMPFATDSDGAGVGIADLALSYEDGFGSASYASIAPGLVSGGSVEIEFTDLDPFARRVRLVVQSDDPVHGFLSPGVTFPVDGAPIAGFGVVAGQDFIRDLLPIFDPAFEGLVADGLEAFDTEGSTLPVPGVTPLLIGETFPDGSFGGTALFTDDDGDITDRGLARIEISVLYAIPAPSSLAILAIAGVFGMRRDRAVVRSDA